MLGAIDGHAKNFSLRIESQGRYQLTPLYDVISAYPLAVKRQIEWQSLKMAMSLKGKNRLYAWANIQLRHWLEMAKKCQFSVITMQEIVEDVCDNMESIITRALKVLPTNFPTHISEPIFFGMRQIKNRCIKRAP